MARVHLAFSSGGIKGVAFAGALEKLEPALRRGGHTLGRLVGSSAGSLFATLVAAGYDAAGLLALCHGGGGKPLFTALVSPPGPAETDRLIEAIVDPEKATPARAVLRPTVGKALEKAFDKVVDRMREPLRAPARFVFNQVKDAAAEAALAEMVNRIAAAPLGPSLLLFIEENGVFSAEHFTRWLAERLNQAPLLPGGADADITFADFHSRTGRELSVVAADSTDTKLLVLNHRTAPRCPVVQAVRMSVSIPLVWPEVAWGRSWGRYRGESMEGHLCLDGGAMLNFPVRYLADPEKYREVMGEPEPGPVVGLLLDPTRSVPGDVEPPKSDPTATALDRARTVLLERVGRLINTVTAWENDAVRPFDVATCHIPTRGYGSMEFALNPARVEVLINSGRCAMAEFLKGRTDL
jgi:predicted acylesterase/phospholipase RssA